MRLEARPHERIDRDRTVTFSFEGQPIRAFEGDTVGSALFAAGRRTFTRSFKYHRPRGLLCCTGHCPNCQMTVDGTPNVRVCTMPAHEGMVVKAQNVVGSLDRDLMAITDKLGGPFVKPGFYYKTFIRPKRFWPAYEKFLRGAAGLGPLDPETERTERYDVEHRHVDVLVVGGGRSGLQAAIDAAEQGRHVALVDEGPAPGGELLLDAEGAQEAAALATRSADLGVELFCPATAIGAYEGGLVPVQVGNLLIRFRAEHVVAASGVTDQPLVFPGNDLVGIMFPTAVRRLVNFWSLRPGNRAVVLTVDDRGLAAADDLREAGVVVADVVDFREHKPSSIKAEGSGGRVKQLTVDGKKTACDLVVMAGSPQPAYQLLAHAGATVSFDSSRGIFVPTNLPEHLSAVGGAAGDVGEVATPAATHGTGKSFVCYCEDQTAKDLKYAIDEGYDSIQLAKRYTTVTMGPCQGKLCHLNSVRVYAKATHSSEEEIGTTTARPPWTPISMGLLAGRPHETAKRTSMHHRHKDMGARVFWTGAWRRPHSYGPDPQAEAQAVHESIGIIDVSTLGKLLVKGPDAGAFLDRLYPNRFSDLKVGRIRYGILTTDGGRIFDDGTIARLAEDEFYVTTTSTGADGVFQWFEWWNASWHMDVELANVTGAVAAVNVAGPNARKLMEKVCNIDVGNEAFTYLDAKHAHVAGAPALILRIGFVGELGYEIHFPSPHGEHVWDALFQAGEEWKATPFGLEPQRILRLEKMHILVGQDTDGESNPLEAAMSWIVKLDKDDFVGKWAIEHVQERGLRSMLVGFEKPDGQMPVEGAQVVIGGKSAGRITSVRWSEQLQKVIGMAVVPIELAEEGSTFDVKIGTRIEQAIVRTKPFFDPEGAHLRS
ncbi:MAG: 2Fe-2S iron-sulfur cluster-binding protein [Gaiellales bacterium]